MVCLTAKEPNISKTDSATKGLSKRISSTVRASFTKMIQSSTESGKTTSFQLSIW